MRSVVYTRYGDPSVLELVDRPVPEPGPGEVRVRLMVSGVNPTDWKARQGSYGTPPPEGDTVPNQDGAGVVDAVGSAVDFAVGDRVWVSLAAHQRPTSGTAQEYTLVPTDRLFRLPVDASFAVGAAVGVPGITAHRALTVAEGGPDRLGPRALATTTVLVAGGAGAVGNAAVQLAHWAGASVIATVSSDEKGRLAMAAGADHVVNYRADDAVAKVRRIAPGGVDLVVEVAPAANAALDLEVLRPGGTVSTYATNGGSLFELDIRRSMGLNARYQFVLLYTLDWGRITAAADDLNAAIESGGFGVGEEHGLPLHWFDLEETAAAHRSVEQGAVGKVLVRVSPEADAVA